MFTLNVRRLGNFIRFTPRTKDRKQCKGVSFDTDHALLRSGKK